MYWPARKLIRREIALGSTSDSIPCTCTAARPPGLHKSRQRDSRLQHSEQIDAS